MGERREWGGGEVVFQPGTKILPTISQQKVWRNNKMIFGRRGVKMTRNQVVKCSADQLVFGGCKSGGGGGAGWVQDQCSGLFALPQW